MPKKEKKPKPKKKKKPKKPWKQRKPKLNPDGTPKKKPKILVILQRVLLGIVILALLAVIVLAIIRLWRVGFIRTETEEDRKYRLSQQETTAPETSPVETSVQYPEMALYGGNNWPGYATPYPSSYTYRYSIGGNNGNAYGNGAAGAGGTAGTGNGSGSSGSGTAESTGIRSKGYGMLFDTVGAGTDENGEAVTTAAETEDGKVTGPNSPNAPNDPYVPTLPAETPQVITDPNGENSNAIAQSQQESQEKLQEKRAEREASGDVRTETKRSRYNVFNY